MHANRWGKQQRIVYRRGHVQDRHIVIGLQGAEYRFEVRPVAFAFGVEDNLAFFARYALERLKAFPLPVHSA
ncbi:hypothetical protein D3C77_635160 [compost metagenome]